MELRGFHACTKYTVDWTEHGVPGDYFFHLHIPSHRSDACTTFAFSGSGFSVRGLFEFRVFIPQK